MNHIDAVAIVKSFATDAEKAITEQSIERLVKLIQERGQLLLSAGHMLQQEVEHILAEQTDGPFTKLIEAFWFYFKASLLTNTVNGIVQEHVLHQQMAAEQAAQQAADPAFAALDGIADETLGKR